MTTDPTPDFDGCNSECRRAGAHTLRWGGCEHAPKPEPTVSMSVVYDAADGHKAIGYDSYTVTELAELIEPALRTIKIRIGPNARGMLERGEEVRLSVGEYVSLALAAADAIAHRNEPAAPAFVSPPPATDRAGLREQVAEALMRWAEGNNDPQYARMRRSETVRANAYSRADAVLAVLPPATDRTAVLREAADVLDGLTQQPDMTMPEGRWRAGLDAGIRELRSLADGERDEQQAQQDGAETVVDVYRLALRYADALAGSSRADARTWSYALRWFSQLVRGGGLARYARDSFGIKFGIEAPTAMPVAASDPRADETGGTVAETLPASTAPLAAGFPLVKGNCPACHGASLFLGTGGYPTCSNHECPEPDAATTMLEQYGHEAHQPEHTWAAELRDPLAEEWAPGTRYAVRERAVDALTHARRLAPTWTDGTATERRLVRATTTYTVETPAAVPVTGQPPADTGEEARFGVVTLSTRCDACRHTLNWHRNDVGCTVALCVCGTFREPVEELAQ